jgi:hypothetical protein
MSLGVQLAEIHYELVEKCKKISRTKHLINELWDFGRSIKHRGYKKESLYRKKFIIQNYIPIQTNDWKILIYGSKYYVLCREVRDNDFRASGSGKFIFREDIPSGLLNFAEEIFKHFEVPNLSIDLAFDGMDFFLLEFQALYFGTTTIEKSPFYFFRKNGDWRIVKEKSELEREYVASVISFIEKHFR